MKIQVINEDKGPLSEITSIKRITIADQQSQGAYTTIPQEISLFLPECREDTLILSVLNQNEQFHRHYRISRKKFFLQMKHWVEELEKMDRNNLY